MAMNTIRRILGPSITLLWPLVGGSLASDWVRSQIFEIKPAVGQRMAIAQRHASLSFLDIDVLPLYMYMKGQWTLSAPF